MESIKKKKKWWNIVLDVLFWSVLAFITSVIVVNAIDINTGYSCPYFGYRTSVIVTASMSYKNADNTYLTDEMKQIQIDDVITTKTYRNYDQIEKYDVVTFVNTDNVLVAHRVIDKYESEGSYYVITRGDANNMDDAPVRYESIKGKVVSITPKVGKFVRFVKSIYFAMALFFSLFFLFLGLYIADVIKFKKSKKMNTESNNGWGCSKHPRS